MTPPRWMSHLVRARTSQEDTATQRLAFARRAQDRAHAEARREAKRLEVLARQNAESDAGAFVAAAVALQSAAATHAAAVGEAGRADAWVVTRRRELTEAAVSRHVAEQLHERAQAEHDAVLAQRAQQDLDEAAAATHLRAHGEDR